MASAGVTAAAGAALVAGVTALAANFSTVQVMDSRNPISWLKKWDVCNNYSIAIFLS